MPVALLLTLESLTSVDGDRFPGGQEAYLLFNSDIVNYLLKATVGRGRRLNLLIFVGWSALIAGGWLVVAWGRKCCLGPADFTSLVCLV